jgi:uncharacterized protein YggE
VSYKGHVKSLLLICCFATGLALNAAEPELKGTLGEVREHLAALDRIVTVSGDAEVKSPADRAIVTLRLTSESKSLQEALRANQLLRAKLVNTLKERGIAAERIDAGKFSSTPRHWIFSEKVKSYKVENLVKVTVVEERELQDTARMLDELNGVEYGGMEFEHSKKQELKRKALAQALEAASARKKVYEEQLAVALTPVKFSESTGMTPARAPRGYPAIDSSSAGKLGYVAEPEAASGFGEMVFSAQVTVHYSVAAR